MSQDVAHMIRRNELKIFHKLQNLYKTPNKNANLLAKGFKILKRIERTRRACPTAASTALSKVFERSATPSQLHWCSHPSSGISVSVLSGSPHSRRSSRLTFSCAICRSDLRSRWDSPLSSKVPSIRGCVTWTSDISSDSVMVSITRSLERPWK